jgi:hypothetical protein
MTSPLFLKKKRVVLVGYVKAATALPFKPAIVIE